MPAVNLQNIAQHVNESVKLIRAKKGGNTVNPPSRNIRKHQENKSKSHKKEKEELHQTSAEVKDDFDGVFDDIDAIVNSFKVIKL